MKKTDRRTDTKSQADHLRSKTLGVPQVVSPGFSHRVQAERRELSLGPQNLKIVAVLAICSLPMPLAST